MRRHEKKLPQKVEIENHPTLDKVVVENSIVRDINEFKRKTGIGESD